MFSKKARVGINGGLSKIGGPHIISVSGWKKMYTSIISVHIRRYSVKESWRSPRNSLSRPVDDQRANGKAKSDKTIEWLKKWNQIDKEIRKTCNMEGNSVEWRAEVWKTYDTSRCVPSNLENLSKHKKRRWAGFYGAVEKLEMSSGQLDWVLYIVHYVFFAVSTNSSYANSHLVGVNGRSFYSQ